MSDTPCTSRDTAAGLPRDRICFGVGAKITVAVMSDHHAEVILDALRPIDATGMVVETREMSTYVGGAEEDLLRYVTDLSAAVAGSGMHASITVHLSRVGSERAESDRPGDTEPRAVEVVGRTTGCVAVGKWALYILADDTTLADDTRAVAAPDHTREFDAAIELARANGTYLGSEDFVTWLEGDLGMVLASAFAGWILVGRGAQHVTSHLTLSVNSPSTRPSRS
jgi:uncharacterized protein YqgV (UPF0045/DUF77 family)